MPAHRPIRIRENPCNPCPSIPVRFGQERRQTAVAQLALTETKMNGSRNRFWIAALAILVITLAGGA
ncbi:MAG: hypothetical protein RIS76_1597, partial [Verrucomicrobiota bacterium]